jgi:hypothetical protein
MRHIIKALRALPLEHFTQAGIQKINIKATGCRIDPDMTKLLDSPVRPGNDKTKEVTFIV